MGIETETGTVLVRSDTKGPSMIDFTVKWVIPLYMAKKFTSYVGDCLTNTFILGYQELVKWKMKLYPCGDQPNASETEFLSIYLHFEGSISTCCAVQCEVSCITCDGTLSATRSRYIHCCKYDAYGFPSFMANVLPQAYMDEFLPGDTFTVCVQGTMFINDLHLGDELHEKLKTSKVSKFFNSKAFSDLTLMVDGVEFYVHKIILASKSEVFCNKFKEMDSDEKTLEIPNVKSDVFRELLLFIYNETFSLRTRMMAKSVLVVAHMYKIRWLELLCEEYLCSEINPLNAVEFFLLAQKTESICLLRATAVFVLENFDDVSLPPGGRRVQIEDKELLHEMEKIRNSCQESPYDRNLCLGPVFG